MKVFFSSFSHSFETILLYIWSDLQDYLYIWFAPNHNLARAFAKGLPIVASIDGINAEAGRQEEHLQFAGEEDVHIEFGEVALIFSALMKELLMRPDDMLHLFIGIELATGIEQHRKFVVGIF